MLATTERFDAISSNEDGCLLVDDKINNMMSVLMWVLNCLLLVYWCLPGTFMTDLG